MAPHLIRKNQMKKKLTRLIPIIEHDLRTIGFTEIETDELSIGFAVLPDDEP
jgi:hypothetical protein